MPCSSCSCSPCVCIPSCSTECPEVISYTFSNANLSGIGVLESYTSGTGEVLFKGIRSANSAILVTNDAATKTVLLTANPDAFQGTVTWANAAARALDAPGFEGQIGVQLDTNDIYQGTGLSAGDWGYPVVTLNRTNTLVTGSTTTFQMAGTSAFNWNVAGTGNVTFTGTSSGRIEFDTLGIDVTNGTNINVDAVSAIQIAGGSLNLTGGFLTVDATSSFDSTGTANLDGTVNLLGAINSVGTFSNNNVFANSGTMNFGSAGRWQVAGVQIPANSLVITSGTAGQVSSRLITTILSTTNTQSYGAPTGTLTRTTFDTATVTLPQLAERVAALITDLKATLKPA